VKQRLDGESESIDRSRKYRAVEKMTMVKGERGGGEIRKERKESELS
jgi:hypothetical protein